YYFSLRRLRPPRSPLFPYTTLFRSLLARELQEDVGRLVLAMRERLRLDGLDVDGLRERLLLRSPLTETARRREQVAALIRQAERSEEHTSELQSRSDLVCRLLLEKK